MSKQRLRVYVDTSVFGGVFDSQFAEPSRCFFARVRDGDFVVLVSPQVLTELMLAPQRVQDVLADLPPKAVERIDLTDEALALADAYISEGILGERSKGDAIHVACATAADADLIVSWNFTHIVRYDRIRMFNGVNVLKGYRPLDIRSPLEVVYENEG